MTDRPDESLLIGWARARGIARTVPGVDNARRRGQHDRMPELTIRTRNGTMGVPEGWAAFLSRELRDEDGFVIVDDGRRNSYAQAGRFEGTLVLEYRDGSPRRHFQARGVGIGDVAEAVSQWADGRRDFVERHEWTRLEDWDPPPEQPGT